MRVVEILKPCRHTNTFSKVRVFRCHKKNASIDSRPHYRFDAFLTAHTKTFENDKITCCDVSSTPYVHATNTCACDIFRHRFHFKAYSTILFVLIHFQERFQIDAFTKKTVIVLVWTEGLNASKCMRFQTHERQTRRGARVKWRDSPFLPNLGFAA